MQLCVYYVTGLTTSYSLCNHQMTYDSIFLDKLFHFEHSYYCSQNKESIFEHFHVDPEAAGVDKRVCLYVCHSLKCGVLGQTESYLRIHLLEGSGKT